VHFKDGSQCDAWDYYNASALPVPRRLPRRLPRRSDNSAVAMEVCDGQAQAMPTRLDVLEVTKSEEPISDP